MGDYPVGSDSTVARTFAGAGWTRASTLGKTFSTGAINVKGAWNELIPAAGTDSLKFDAYGFLLGLQYVGTTATYLIDIGFGTTVILPNLFIEGLVQRLGGEVFVPLPIPAGTQVQVRGQSSAANLTLAMSITPLGQGFLPSTWPGAVQTLGVTSSAATSGTLLDPGATANTKGAFTTVGTLTRPCSMLLFMMGSRADATLTTATWFLDIAIGAAGSEQVVYGDIPMCASDATDQLAQHAYGPYPFSAPANTRISARLQCSINTATKRTLNIAAYAFG
jgi:hypothetical protein